jgi:hypothetical protein
VVTESDQHVEHVENHGRIEHAVIVELAKESDVAQTFLLFSEIVQLQSNANPFEQSIDELDTCTMR